MRVSGVTVGSVTDIDFIGSEVEMLLELREDMQERVRSTSLATIGSVSLLGEGAVDINAMTTGQPIPEWGYIKVGVAPGSIAQLTTEAGAGISEARLLVEDIRKGRGTIGQLFTNDSVYKEFDALIA